MRRLLILAVTAVVVLAVAAPAFAKGPVGATITGPGITEPIVVEGNGEFGAGGGFSGFVEAAGFWELVFGTDPHVIGGDRVIAAQPPSADLGSGYTVSWDLSNTRVEMVVYPHAAGGAVTYVEPDVPIGDWDMSTEGGWVYAGEPLAPFLAEYGVPMPDAPAKAEIVEPVAAPTPAPPAAPPVEDTGLPIPALAAAAAALLAWGGWWLFRPRRVAAP